MWAWDQFFLGLAIGFFGIMALAVLIVLLALIGWMNSGSH
jgi:hypothetical protein